jgi:hypothetical protein
MSQARLLACPACARHIRVSEPVCLFCGLVLPDSFGAEPAIPPPPRLTRAGLVSYRARAIAASTAALVTASCGGSLTASTSETDASSAHDSAYGGGDTSALYGADSATGDSALQEDSSGGGFTGGSTTAYGGPGLEPVDASAIDAGVTDATLTPDTAPPVLDASDPDVFRYPVLYGAPPMP